jgi:hypothetical protein
MRKAIFTYPVHGLPAHFYPEHSAHSGQTVEVLGSVTINDGPTTFTVRASDGWEAEVWEDELTFIEE